MLVLEIYFLQFVINSFSAISAQLKCFFVHRFAARNSFFFFLPRGKYFSRSCSYRICCYIDVKNFSGRVFDGFTISKIGQALLQSFILCVLSLLPLRQRILESIGYQVWAKSDSVLPVMVSMLGGAWSEISKGAAVKHFVVAVLWYFLRGAALTFFVGAT